MEFLEKINLCEEAPEARKLLREMREKDLPPVMYAYHSALAVCANATAWQDAKELLQEMEKDRLTPDHTAYHFTMDAGRVPSGAPVDFAEGLFKEMQMRGMMPTSDSYTKVILAYLQQGNEKAAENFFREAVRQGLLQIWTNGGVFLQLYDYPTEVAVFILRLAISDRAKDLVGRKAGKRTIHVLTRQPEMPRNLPGQGLLESTVMGVLAEFGIKGRVEPSDFGRIRIRGEELERYGCELEGVPMKKKVRAR